jgi:hypothetical protein
MFCGGPAFHRVCSMQYAGVLWILQGSAAVASCSLLHCKTIAADGKAARRLHSTLQRISMPLTISATISRELWQCSLSLHRSAASCYNSWSSTSTAAAQQ